MNIKITPNIKNNGANLYIENIRIPLTNEELINLNDAVEKVVNQLELNNKLDADPNRWLHGF